MAFTEASIPNQDGKVAIVTGANSGIGFETARALAAKGAHVVLACRNQEKGADAVARIEAAHPGASVELGSLDLSSLASVRTFATELQKLHPRVDLLVNNAGVMVPPYQRTQDGFELQFGTNHLGHFALTGQLLPALLKSDAPRVVNVASLAHKMGEIHFDDLAFEAGYKPWAAYGQSKLANLLFTYELGRWLEAKGLPVVVAAAHPGWTATNLQQTSAMARLFNPIFAMKPIGGALPTLYAATAPDVHSGDYIGPSGLGEMRGAPKKVQSNARSKDRQTAARLWTVSEELTGVRFDASVEA